MTRALAANGAHKIYVLGRRLKVLEKVAAEYPDVIIPHQADVTSKQDLQAADGGYRVRSMIYVVLLGYPTSTYGILSVYRLELRGLSGMFYVNLFMNSISSWMMQLPALRRSRPIRL
jgi:hypothetical protein